jgi:hypothetical protein
MKTKNIFRMLLVAVTLLLGANNVMADDYSISFNITGTGTVTADKETANEGDVVNLTVTPGTGQQIKSLIVRDQNWNEIANGVTQFTMPAMNVVVYAEFEAIQYAITINPSEHGSLNVYSGSTAAYGQEITISPQAEWGYELEEGSVTVVDTDNHPIDVSSDLKFTMPASDVTISGTFKATAVTPTKYKLTYYTKKDNVSTLYKEYEIEEGAIIPTEPDPDAIVGYTFGGWDMTNIPETMPNYNLDIYGTYTANDYTITVIPSEHGSLSAYRETAHYGDEIEIHPQADWGYELESVSVVDADNHPIDVSSDLKFTMPASDITISGTFKAIAATQYTITLDYDNTKGSVSCQATSQGNEQIHITVTPNEGYEVASVTVTDANGNSLNVYNSYDFYLGTTNVTVTVTFRAASTVTYSVWNANNIQNGSVSANPTSAEEGTTITLSCQPNTGYELDHYIVTDTDNNSIEVVNGNQFIMPASNVYISAVFKLVNYTVTVNEAANGTVSADKTTNVHYGDEVTLTINPAEGYELDVLTVKDANNNNVNVNNNKFNMPASNVTVTATFKQTGSGPVGPTIPEDIENEHRLWTGPESAEGSDGHVYNLTANLFADIKTGDTFRVYVSDINNDQNWKLYITDNVNSWGSQVFDGFTGGDILRDNGGSTYYHAEDGYGYFEFTCTDQSVTNFKNNGTQMSFQWMTITKVTYISNNTTPTEKTRFSFSFNQSYIYVTYGVDTFTGQYPSANKQLGDEVWNNLTWSSSNTYVADVDNNGNVTINGIGTTYITVSFAGNDNYYATSETYTLVVQPNVRTASIGTSGYATFSCDVALDFYGITSLRAYIAKSIDANWVVLEQVTGTVAANTGLVIVGTTTDIPVADSGTSYSNNLLVPGTGASVGGAGIYVLTNESGTVKFADTSAHSATVPVGKAYLQASGTSAARLNIRWEGDATGIKALKSDFNSDDVIYDLNGQRVITPNKGLYIINGKKVVIK